MIDLQQALVADHIAGLEREGAALRAERARADDHARSVEPAETQPVPLPVVTTGSPRVRIGRWLVGIGTAIAGPARPVDATVAPNPASDDPDIFSHAA